jgi:hypothetical protein
MSDEGSRPENPLEGLVRPWFFPSLAFTAVVGVAIFYVSGVLSESAVGGVLAVGVPIVLAFLVARPAFSDRLDRATRWLLLAAAVLTVVVAAVPAFEAVHPGEPLFVAEFDRLGEGAAVPPGVKGPVLLLVSAQLAGGGEPSISFTLGGFEAPVDGKLERTVSYARVGRGGRARVAHDRDSDWIEARLPADAKAIRLDRAQGLGGAPLRVEVHKDHIPHVVAWIVSLVVLLLAAAGEVRAGREAGGTVAAGVALGFALVVSYNVTPAHAVVPSVWAVVLGAIVGAPAAVLARTLMRRVLPRA